MQGRSAVTAFCLIAASIAFAPARADLVGSTPGDFEVTSMGSAHYEVPLVFPDGINGLTPKLSLEFDSRYGNGLAGVGARLKGLSHISRCRSTLAQNNGLHTPDYSTSDRLCLNGNQLRLRSGTYWQDGATYRAEMTQFSKIVQHGSGNSTWFELFTAKGLVFTYGATSESRITSTESSKIRVWAVSRISDHSDAGNRIDFHYTTETGAYRVSSITYGGTASTASPYNIKFSYANNSGSSYKRPDRVPQYFAGGEVYQQRRVKRSACSTTVPMCIPTPWAITGTPPAPAVCALPRLPNAEPTALACGPPS